VEEKRGVWVVGKNVGTQRSHPINTKKDSVQHGKKKYSGKPVMFGGRLKKYKRQRKQNPQGKIMTKKEGGPKPKSHVLGVVSGGVVVWGGLGGGGGGLVGVLFWGGGRGGEGGGAGGVWRVPRRAKGGKWGPKGGGGGWGGGVGGGRKGGGVRGRRCPGRVGGGGQPGSSMKSVRRKGALIKILEKKAW